MQIHRVRGNNLQDALRRARKVHGDRALVVSQEALSDGGVALAVAQGVGGSKKPGRNFTDAPAVVPHEFPKESAQETETHAGLLGVESHLAEHGASPRLIARILKQIDRDRLKDHHAVDVAAEAIGQLYKIARAPRVPGRTRIMSVLGPAGGGKTSALIKIAYRLLQADLNIGFASLDTDRVGANDKLRAWSKRLKVPFYAVRDASQLEQLLASESPPEVLLLDSSGNASSDISKLLALAETSGAQSMQNFLVLPATDNRSALSKQASAFSGVEIAGAIVTKLDETNELGTAFESILDRDMPIAFLSDGQNVSENLHRASADSFADLLLTGRIS